MTPDQNKCDKDDLCICQKCNAENVFKKSGIDCYGRKLSTPDQREKALKYATRERDAFARQVRDCQSATHSEFKNALPMYQNRLEIYEAIVAALTAPPQVLKNADVIIQHERKVVKILDFDGKIIEVVPVRDIYGESLLTSTPQVPQDVIDKLRKVQTISAHIKSKRGSEMNWIITEALALLTQGRE